MSPSPFTPIEHEIFSLRRLPTPITAFILRETHLLKLTRAFKDTFGGQGIFSKPEPMLIDLSGIENSGKWVDFPALISLLRNYQLEPIAVLGGNAKQREQAAQAKLPHIESHPLSTNIEQRNGPSPAPEPEGKPANAEKEAPAPLEAKPQKTQANGQSTAELPAHSLNPPTVIRHPVRSGSELYAKQADLIVISMVGAGARVVADGSIYVHGALKGTAAAGVNGMPQARIFCESFEPEIIAINGIYLDGEQLAQHPAWGKRVLIELDQNGQLDIRVFS